MRRTRSSVWVMLVSLVWATGCVPVLPENTKVGPPARVQVSEADGVTFWAEPDVDDAFWMEIPRAHGGTVGGYLSHNESPHRSLVILLHGASTYESGGSTGAARQFHQGIGRSYRDAGYQTFSLDFRECGTPYGQGDLEDLLDVLEFLEQRGKALLGVDRVYTMGYSVGATLAMLANRQRPIAAVAAIAGVTEPRQFERSWDLYHLVARLYGHNQGLCQLGTTLAAYGPPGSPAWQMFNTVQQVAELTSPMIVVQGTLDQIYSIDNARNLDAAYARALLAGIPLPVVQFLYLEGSDHFVPMRDDAVTQSILEFFARFRD